MDGPLALPPPRLVRVLGEEVVQHAQLSPGEEALHDLPNRAYEDEHDLQFAKLHLYHLVISLPS